MNIKGLPIIGILVTRNEEDIIAEAMEEYSKHFDAIYCLDCSDDKTPEIISSFKVVRWLITDKDLGMPSTQFRDGKRQFLLSKVQDDFGYSGWIFSIQGDEIFYGDIEKIVVFAENEKANVINCLPAHFVIHPSEKDIIEGEDTKIPIQQRRLWYFLALCENAGFKNQAGLYYNLFEHMRTIPHGFQPMRTCSKVIIRRHYNMRSIKQIKDRIEDRVSSGWQPNYKHIKDNFFISDPRQICIGGPIYSAIQKFDGEFKFAKEHEDWCNLLI